MKKYIPNLLSCSRFIFSLGTLVTTWKEIWGYCLLFLTLGIASDLLDGYLARKWGAESNLGKELDNKADLALSGSVVIGFWLNGTLSFVTIVVLGIAGLITISPYFLPGWSSYFGREPRIYRELGDALTGFYFVVTLIFFVGLLTYKIFGSSCPFFILEILVVVIGAIIRRKKLNYWLVGLKFWRE